MIKKIILSFLVLMLLSPFSAGAETNSKISVDMEYIILSPDENGSTVITDMTYYKNMTTEDYAGDEQSEGVLNVTIPEGATELTILDEKIQYKQTETGFITTDPIPASGSTFLPYSYKVKQGQDIGVTFNYPVSLYQVLIPEGLGSIEGKDAELTNQGLMDIDGKSYWSWAVQNIQQNQTVTFSYDKDKQPSGEGNKSSATANENVGNVTKTAPDFHNPGHIRMWEQSMLKGFNPHIVMIVLGAILIAGIGYFTYFRLKGRKQDILESDKEEKAFKLLMSKQKAILDKILELEDSYEKGQISEDDYHARLGAYKQHLVQVKVSLSQFVE